MFLFDYWIKSGDRNLTQHGGNPNLFIRSDLQSFIVLDHNLAFDVDFDESFNAWKELHVGSSAWFSEQRSLLDHEDYEKLLENCFSKLDSILESIPEEWLESCGDDGIVEYIRVTLSRFRKLEFWEGIK